MSRLVHALVCPRCGGELVGLDFDVLFACPICTLLVDPVTRETYPIERVPAPRPTPGGAPAGPLLDLPFWVFEVTLVVAKAPRAALARMAEGVAARVRRAYVAAFAIDREEYFGDPGLVWTRRQEAVVLIPCEAGTGAPLVGVRRGLAAARAHVLPYLLQLVDEREDITGLEADASIGAARVIAVPFVDEGTHLRDARTELRYPEAAIDDLDAIRETLARDRPRRR